MHLCRKAASRRRPQQCAQRNSAQIRWQKCTTAGIRHSVVKGRAARTGADAFVTRPGPFVDLVSGAVAAVTGRSPALSTTGGTSDARFIKNYCPVLEFGLVGQTMHQVDERTPVADLVALTAIYRTILDRYFA